MEKGLVGKGVGSGDRRVKRKSERRAASYIRIYRKREPTKVGRRGMKRGDFPSAVYVAFLLPVSSDGAGGTVTTATRKHRREWPELRASSANYE